MKTSRHILSNTGIFAVTAILLTVAATLAFVGIGLEAQNQIKGITAVSAKAGDQLTSYVMAGVMGEIPSVAGTLQSLALAIAYGLTPVIAVSMFVARAFIKADDTEDFLAA